MVQSTSEVWLCADEKDPDRQLVAMKVGHSCFLESCLMAGVQVEEERDGTGVMSPITVKKKTLADT